MKSEKETNFVKMTMTPTDLHFLLAGATVLSLGLWFGVFFGVNYPEIQEFNFQLTTCNVTAATIVPRYCCNTNCDSSTSGCNSAPLSSLSCGELISQTQALNPTQCHAAAANNSNLLVLTPSGACPPIGVNAVCNGGYTCCATQCQTCQSCAPYCIGSGANRYCSLECTDYSCNCQCTRSTNNDYCTLNCDTCYTTNLIVTYPVNSNVNITLTKVITQDFSTDLSAANITLESMPLGFNFTCYYDPGNPSDLIFNRNFTAWKWVLFGFCTLPIYACLMIYTFLGLVYVIPEDFFEKETLALALTISIWIGLILPLGILLPSAIYGYTNHTGMVGLLAARVGLAVGGNMPLVMFICWCMWDLYQWLEEPVYLPPMRDHDDWKKSDGE